MEHNSAPVTGVPQVSRVQAGKYRGDLASSSLATSSFKLDEGYSDETKSQTENESIQSSNESLTLPEWILSYSETDRAELAYSLLGTLRTSTIAAVVDRLTPILHMDPMHKLPPEITAEIFSYLDPSSLLTASLTSREWRARILDSRLWRHLYIREGWAVDVDEVRNFEQQQQPLSQHRKSRSRQSDTDMGQPKQKRRVPPGWMDSRSNSQLDGSTLADAVPAWNEQHSAVEADVPSILAAEHSFSADTEGDHEMQDASYEDLSPMHSMRQRTTSSSEPTAISLITNNNAAAQSSKNTSFSSPVSDAKALKTSPLFTRQCDGSVKLDWTHLYKQRRKLEENWRKGRFTNFQLPHPSYPREAHQECVYAIQFCGKWLVSGSRDRTVRVWDLDTRRLRGPPLVGHSQSVLCLQFDPSEEEDIIASGSSDNSVIIWKFSTGEKIHKLASAHEDSVLNLRFDSRFLVTCSKDKLIKVWNRQQLCPTDENYPTVVKGSGVRYPSYIVDTSIIPPSILEAQLAKRQIRTLPPFTLLMTLDGHGAAVNAIQLDENEIVSASGDRLIKVWDIHSGSCLKTLIGHQKGIACVQFDSRRIVSGSNDDTVRIYDHASGAEVACLQGHRDLVRTVQAGFGDPPGAEETLRLEAMAVDKDYWEALRRGDIRDTVRGGSRRRSQAVRSTGSRHPKDIMAVGAKIPPGGGGSSWGRIVSGSYDETIIIWKKDEDGKWVVGQRLRQEHASKAALEAAIQENHSEHHGEEPQSHARQPPSAPQQQSHNAHHTPQNHPLPQPPQNAGPASQTPTVTLPQPHQVAQQQIGGNVQAQAQWIVHTTTTVNHPQSQPQSQPQPQPSSQHQLLGHTTTQTVTTHHPTGGNTTTTQVQNMNANGTMVPVSAAQHHFAPPPHPTSRVFKLQFDARKLICASQDFKIVGWDFACGDEELEEACRFFIGL